MKNNQPKTPTHIFFVENDRLYVRMLDYIFSKDFSFRFVHFKSAEECLENLHLQPDVIIMDHSLPGIKGLDALRELRLQCPNIYILVVLSDREGLLPSQLFEAGADDYILKETLKLEQVEEKVENFLNRESLSKNVINRIRRKPMKQIYYFLLALAALSAGVFYYQ